MNLGFARALVLLSSSLHSVPAQDSVAEATAAPRPNVLLILCDDMGFSDLGCYGGEVETPNLDRLAAEGMRFTQFYNNAKCTTTRASIVTGLWPRRPEHLTAAFPTIGEQLRHAGYRTALTGKWHLGATAATHPFERGFERFYGLLDGACNFFDPAQRDPDFKGGRVRAFGRDDTRITEFPDDFYTTDAFTDAALEAIEAFAAGDAPWFVHVCYTAPHYPLHAKPGDIAKYRGKYRALGGWEAMRQMRFERQQKLGLVDETWALTDTDSRSYAWDGADQDWEDLRMAVYAAMIDSMDQNIGRILATLARTGELDDTLILFLSDNGGCAEEPGGRNTERVPGPKEHYTAVGPAWGWAQNAPFKRYKSWVHEGGISTPLIVRWPGVVPEGAIQRAPGHIVDFVPTFLELAGAEPIAKLGERDAPPLDGESLVPLLHGGTRPGPERWCWFWAGNRAIREGDWKLVWDKRTQAWELYDLATDRCETNDRSAQHGDRVRAMAERWFAWAAATGVKVKRG